MFLPITIMLSRPGWGWRRNSFQSACQSNTLELPPLAPEEWLVLKSFLWYSFWILKSDVFSIFFSRKENNDRPERLFQGPSSGPPKQAAQKRNHLVQYLQVSIHMVSTVQWTSGPVPARPAGKTPTRFLVVSSSSAIIVTLKSGCIQKGLPLCTYKTYSMNLE